MLDHVSLTVSDVTRAKAFFDMALAPLGIAMMVSGAAEGGGGPAYVGYGSHGRLYFWIGAGLAGRAHVAFTAADRKTVDAFYAAAIAAGGRDNGPPGIRGHYHPSYYGAFVLDPDGHNIEAVCHAPA
jgi:catechol 2,3-dioxygenase-like lactoylglutathione lyase family enzyme